MAWKIFFIVLGWWFYSGGATGTGKFIWICVGISFIISWIDNEKKLKPDQIGPRKNAPEEVVNRVNWNSVEKRIKDIKNALACITVINIKSEGERSYAEPIGGGTLSYNTVAHPSRPAWHLSALLDIDQGFVRRHASDYVTIDYPYTNPWEEILDNNSTIHIYISDDYSSAWLVCYLQIPSEISHRQIIEHVGNALK